jgi:hypothetical protein
LVLRKIPNPIIRAPFNNIMVGSPMDAELAGKKVSSIAAAIALTENKQTAIPIAAAIILFLIIFPLLNIPLSWKSLYLSSVRLIVSKLLRKG